MSEQILEYRNIIGALIVVFGALLAILAMIRILRALRVRKIITKGAEASLRLILAGLITLIAVLSAVSTLLDIQYGLVASVIMIVILLLPAIYAMFSYVSNLFSYLVFSLSGTIAEGDYIRVDIGNQSYEGRAYLSMGEFLELRADDGNVIYVPYGRLHGSVITKLAGAIVNIKLTMRGRDLNVAEATQMVEKALSDSSSIDKSRSSFELTMIQEAGDERRVTFMIRARLVNPRNVEKAKEEIMRYFIKAELPYDVSLAVMEE